MNVQNTVTIRRPKISTDKTKIKLMILSSIVTIFVLLIALGEIICPYDPYLQNYNSALQSPNTEHIFGTDRYGRDMLSRVIIGVRTSIFATLSIISIITILGTILGVVAGYYQGKVDEIIMRVSDIFLAFPQLVFALTIAALLNGGLYNAIIALAIVSWPKYARIARSQTLIVVESEYIMAAKIAANKDYKIIIKHILPNISGLIFVTAMSDIGTMMMELAALSFLGLGATPPIAELGNMMNDGRSMLQIYPWIILAPGFMIFLTVVLFNLLGDCIRDYTAVKNI